MRTFRLTVLKLLLFLFAACGGTPGHTQGPSFANAANIYLRNAFDTDPSLYVGRFVPRGAADLDESSAMPLGCSRFIGHRFVDAGGVRMTESMLVSSELAARLGIPGLASAGGATESRREVRVEYTLLGKIVADVADPTAFAQCCQEHPEQCTDRYIGEFMQGTGVVYRADSRQRSGGVEGTHPGSGVGGSIGAGDAYQWTQAIEFPNPVYFAFKVTPNMHRRASSSCGRWVDSPPYEEGYVHFVGTSSAQSSELAARERAARAAQEQAYYSAADHSNMEVLEDPAALRWALGMQVVHSCVEVDASAKKPRYVGRVLGRLPLYVPAQQ